MTIGSVADGMFNGAVVLQESWLGASHVCSICHCPGPGCEVWDVASKVVSYGAFVLTLTAEAKHISIMILNTASAISALGSALNQRSHM